MLLKLTATQIQAYTGEGIESTAPRDVAQADSNSNSGLMPSTVQEMRQFFLFSLIAHFSSAFVLLVLVLVAVDLNGSTTAGGLVPT